VVVTGIPGVGKTTVLNELQDLAQQSNFDLTIVNFGTVMNEIMHGVGKNMHRDNMRQQTIETQKRTQELAAHEIVKRAERNPVMIDTHMSVRTSSGMWAGLPKNILDIIKPQLLVLIEANPEHIAARRQGDLGRRREQSLREEIVFDLEWSRATAAASGVETGAPVKVIRNDTGRQKQAALELFQAVRNIMENQI
jgi:adenylate kinase